MSEELEEIEEKVYVKLLRNLYVDYNNTTPNELRFNNNNILDVTIYYPLGNIYPIKNELKKLPYLYVSEDSLQKKDWFENKLKDDQISYSIIYLQIESLKHFIVKNYKSKTFGNPFHYLFVTYYPIKYNIESAIEIIKVLIENYDDHIKFIEDLFYIQYIKNNTIDRIDNEEIYELLCSMVHNNENICYICLNSLPNKYLINPCDCKTPVHATCLIKLFRLNYSNNCKVCKKKYRKNSSVYRQRSILNLIYFPFDDLYYEPLVEQGLKKYYGMERLTMAIVYLQVERVSELLKEKEVLNKLSTYYFGYEGYEQTPIIALCTGNFFSNCSIYEGDNIEKYKKILKLLLDTNKINIDKKDGFGKNAFYYIKQYNLQDLQIIIDSYVKKS